MAFRLEPLHLSVEDSDTVNVTLFRMLAEQLLPDTDPENGLLETADHLVKPACSQILHRLTGVPLTRKQHLVCFRQQLGIISQSGLNPHPSECINHRVDVACVIFYDSYVHYEKIIVLFLYVRILRCICFDTACESTIFSRSFPLSTRLSGVSLCVIRVTSCSMMGPASRSAVT